MIDIHSFGDWLRQIKGDTGGKKVQQPDCACVVGGEGCFKKGERILILRETDFTEGFKHF